MTNDFLQICRERGFIHQCTDEDGLRELLAQQKGVPAYIGFDCTAPSLHVGSLLQIMILRWWQKCGHQPIVLMGGGTTKIGDPSGKDQSRQMLDAAAIARNLAGIRQVFAKFLEFEDSHDCHPGEGRGPDAPGMRRGKLRRHDNKAIMVNNADWLSHINYLDFLRDIGKHFSINRMLTMESVKQRLERDSYLSFLEFNYMILQAYDFVELNKRLDCRLQIGGSDQWGNIVMGTELNRKLKNENKEWRLGKGILGDVTREKVGEQVREQKVNNDLFGLTTPLLTTASGAKMGKTAEGAVWLNHDPANPDFSRSPYDYWQFWRNTEDTDVERFLKLFTELDVAEIADLMKGNINDAKKRLATEATALLHGPDAAHEAADTARKVFEGGLAEGLPEITIPHAELEAGIPAFKLLQRAGLAESGSAARRLIQGKGASINGRPFAAEDEIIALSALTTDGALKLSKGKKQHLLVRAI